MRILFITRRYSPSIGGVEKHVREVSLSLRKKGHKVTVISEEDIKYPHIKLLGLFSIWFWLFRNRNLIKQSDIVHCHDVFIWYLPFRFLYPSKPVYTTFHGWEGRYPIPKKNILLKKLSAKLSWGSICVGKYIEKYFGIKADFITYGAVTSILYSIEVKKPKYIVFIGRLERDTGLLTFLEWLEKHEGYGVGFCGDGALRSECERYGKVHGFGDPKPFLIKAEFCIPGGYLSALEAMAYKCKIKVFLDNPLKADYWRLTPFYEWVEEEDVESAYEWVKGQNWKKLARVYIKLWSRGL